MCCQSVFAQTTYTITINGPVASTNYYYNFPCDVTSITVECWGGGGGGGGDNSNAASNGGGGGGGGYASSVILITGGTYTFTMACGGGGTAGLANGGNGGTGGTTTFNDGVYNLTANGGAGGNGTGGAGGNGGISTGGTTNTTGANGTVGTAGGAGGAGANGGAGGGAAANNNTGNAGTPPGGGGSGGNRRSSPNRAGGAGAAGRFSLTFTTSLPIYCNPGVLVTIEPITNVNFAGINNTTGATSTIESEAFCTTANVTLGNTYPISFQGNTAGNYTDYFSVFFDWNQDGDFDDTGEKYDIGTITNSTGVDLKTATGNITIPAYATAGTTSMRVAKNYNAYPTNACDDISYGQFEDYRVNISVPTCTSNLNGLYSVGSGNIGGEQGHFATLTQAIQAYNFACSLTGPVTFALTDASYSAGESFPLIILSRADASSTKTLTIKPNTGVNATISGSYSNALLRLFGADYVIIDGSNNGTNTRNLTFNNSTGNSIWIGGITGNTATNDQVKNCILYGVTTNSNLVVSDAFTIGDPGYFTNITIDNNLVQRAYMGIYTNAQPSSGNGSGLNISKNDLNTSGANALSFGGIYLQGVDGATVSSNNIGNISNNTNQINFGIWTALNTTNTVIEKNSITNLQYTGSAGYAANGIKISTGLANANITIKNNMISGITGDGRSYTTNGAYYSPVGIYAFGTGQGGINIHFNSIRLNGGNTLNSSGAYSFGIALDNNTSASISNNIVQNEVGRSGGIATGVGSVCIAAQTNAAQFITLDYNDLYCNATGSGTKNLGKIAATDYTTLLAWQTATGKEANSINVAPAFTSTSDLHLTAAGSNYALKAGNYVTGITTDIDGDSRNLGLPAIGADEYKVANLWSGNTSTDWGTNTNWDISIVPLSGVDITIPYGVPNMPVLDANRTIGNLSFIKTGVGTVDINGKTFTIGGAITGTGTLTGSSTSNLVLNGTAGTVNFTQTSAATRSLNNLTLGASGTATIGNDLIVYGNVQVNNTADNAMNFNGKSITLKSNVTNTATIDKLYGSTGANLTGATNVTVERWIPLRLTGGTGSGSANNGRAYRVLTSTVTSGTATINESWQEGLKNTVIGVYNVPASPYQNFGTHITGAGGSANGFDITQTNESSLYTFTNGSNINSTLGYPAVTNTNILIDGQKGYFMYIRGDRNVSTQLPYQPAGGMPTSSTTLRAKGTVLKGNITYNISATPGDFSLITNPYPAPLDWDLVSAGNSNIYTFYTFWNSNNGIRGGFVTVPTGSGTNRYIQPGEGFFVQKNGTGGGTVVITEDMKAVGNNDNTVFFTEHTPFESFRASLFLTEANNVRHTADDVLVRYDNNYSAAVDYDDAEEITNWNENIAISRGGTRLALESRPVITDKDTIQLHIKNMRKTNYDFEFTPSLFSNTNLMAELIDNYLHTRTTLSVVNTVTVPFTVNNDAASFATDRFMIVFSKPSGPLPIDISSIKAYEKNSGIQVDWMMSTEQDMDKYEVEKSTDGRHFVKTGTVLSKGNSNIQVNYGWFDANPAFGDNFYRIRAIEKAGTYKYSDIVRVNIGKGISTGISMYPNPFEGNGFNLQLNKFAAGTYTLTMYNSIGQQVYNTTLTHGGGSATQFISLGKELAAGTYTIKINGEGTTITRTITKK
ncbi:MAG: T9SS type A sorting domain-containing protein [Ferruginibacter sp.]|nr:T9SS type A sorting domain-containing protein [Ferruginibacter sp.]